MFLEGLSSSEIGSITFSSRSTVTKYLKAFDIPLKQFTRRQTGSLSFGYRKYGSKSIELRKEQEIIKRIIKLRDKNCSYQKIADDLNKSIVLTKRKKGVWYPKVVRQIFIRNHKLINRIPNLEYTK